MSNDYSEILKQMAAYKAQFLKEQKTIVKNRVKHLPVDCKRDLYILESEYENNKISYEDYIARKIYLLMLANGTYTLKAWRERVNNILSK